VPFRLGGRGREGEFVLTVSLCPVFGVFAVLGVGLKGTGRELNDIVSQHGDTVIVVD
jgi:hypothetical protein